MKHYGGMWDPSKKRKTAKQKYQKQICQSYSKWGNNTRLYCKFSKGIFLWCGFFSDHTVGTVINCVGSDYLVP